MDRSQAHDSNGALDYSDSKERRSEWSVWLRSRFAIQAAPGRMSLIRPYS